MYITGSLYAFAFITHTTPVLILHTYLYPFYARTCSRCTGVDRYFIVISTVIQGLRENGSWRAHALPGRQLRTQSKEGRNWRRKRRPQKWISSESSQWPLPLHRLGNGHKRWAYHVWPQGYSNQEIRCKQKFNMVWEPSPGSKMILAGASQLRDIFKLFMKLTKLRGLIGAVTVTRRHLTMYYSLISQFNLNATEGRGFRRRPQKLQYSTCHRKDKHNSFCHFLLCLIYPLNFSFCCYQLTGNR